MRTGLITGLDNEGPQDFWQDPWIRQPWTDGGRISPPLDRRNPTSVHNQWYEMAILGKPDFVAIGLRSTRDHAWPHVPLFRLTYEDLNVDDELPALCPFIDTAGFDYWNPFDFANPQHRDEFWHEWIAPYFTEFAEGREVRHPIAWEETSDGRAVLLFWTNDPGAVKAVNPQCAHRLLIDIRERMIATGWGPPAFILHSHWVDHDPIVKDLAYGLHDWFDAAKTNWTVRWHQHRGVGICVPSFHDWRGTPQPHRVIDGEGGKRLERTLAGFRTMHADYVFIESYSNLIETAGLYRTEPDGDDTYLRILREHMELSRG